MGTAKGSAKARRIACELALMCGGTADLDFEGRIIARSWPFLLIKLKCIHLEGPNMQKDS